MDIEGIKTSLVARDTALKRPSQGLFNPVSLVTKLGKTKKIIGKD
jgi:hypothetical protein